MPDLYIPPNSYTLDKVTIPQIRMFLQGDGGTGKTWSALSFEHPVILSYDRGSGAHRGRADVVEVPIYDNDFVRKLCPDSSGIVNRKDATIRWLKDYAIKLVPEQTLVIDGMSGVCSAFHRYEEAHPTYSAKTGKKDEFAEWGNKLVYFEAMMEHLKALKCNLVFIGHETLDRGKDGEYNGKIRPLISGQFGDQLKNHFTDYVRQLTCDKPSDLSKVEDKSLSRWGLTRSAFQEMIDTFPRHTVYYWQLESDNFCNCKVSSLVNFPRFIPANYQSFIKYLRK